MVRCPHPTDLHTGILISKIHCKVAHQMDREELFKNDSKPKKLTDANTVLMKKTPDLLREHYMNHF